MRSMFAVPQREELESRAAVAYVLGQQIQADVSEIGDTSDGELNSAIQLLAQCVDDLQQLVHELDHGGQLGAEALDNLTLQIEFLEHELKSLHVRIREGLVRGKRQQKGR